MWETLANIQGPSWVWPGSHLRCGKWEMDCVASLTCICIIWSWERAWVAGCAGWVQCISVASTLASRSLLDPNKAAGLEAHALFLPGETERKYYMYTFYDISVHFVILHDRKFAIKSSRMCVSSVSALMLVSYFCLVGLQDRNNDSGNGTCCSVHLEEKKTPHMHHGCDV